MSNRLRAGVPLTVIFLMALGLRVWGIDFGLPQLYHYDEHFYVNTALKLGTGALNNPPYAAVGLPNILVVEYGTYYLAGRAFGVFGSAQQFEADFRADPSAFYLLGRLTTAVLGAATALLLYRLGTTIANRQTGVLAAGLLAISFLHVRDSHYAVPDIAMSFFVMLAVTLAVNGVSRHNRRFVYVAAIAGGIAISMKWTALPVIVSVWWASVAIERDRRSGPVNQFINRHVIVTLLLFVAGFALTSPQIVLNPAPYLKEAFGQYGAGQAGGFEIWQVDTLPGWLFYGKTLVYGVGSVLLVLGTIGLGRHIALAASARSDLSLIVASFPVIYFLLMGSTQHYFARYALPLVPFIGLWAAEVIWLTARRTKLKQSRLAWGVAAVLILAATAQPAASSVQHNNLLTRMDTRTLAKKWIEANLPASAKIAMDWQTYGPPLSTALRSAPGDSEKVYSVTLVGGSGLADHSIDWYRQQGYDYLIASSFIYQIPLVFENEDAKRDDFYASLSQQLPLVKEFGPNESEIKPDFIFDEIYGPAISLWQRERPGPTIKIFKINQ